jgi:parallel beta-helix repeat protein
LTVALAVGAMAVLTGPAAAEPTQVGSCTTIDSAGGYELTQDLSNDSSTCIEITSGDVVLDGQGFNVTGVDFPDGPGIYANGTAGADNGISNITVKGVTVQDWGSEYDISYQAVNGGTIENVTVRGNSDGILATDSSNLAVADSDLDAGVDLDGTVDTTVRDNDLDITGIGVDRDSGSNNVTIDSNEIESSSNRGIVVENSDGALVRNNTITDIDTFGIEINSADNATITENSVTGQDYRTGIVVQDASGPAGMNNTVITDNTVSNAGDGNGLEVSSSAETLIAGDNISDNLLTDSASDAVDISDSPDCYVIDNDVT